MDYKEFSNAFCGGKRPAQQQRREPDAPKPVSEDPSALMRLFRDKIKARGARGMVGLQRIFKIMDDDGSKSLSLPEFSKAVRDFRVGISEENVPVLFSAFDTNGDGTMDYDEFLYAMRGEMN